MCAASIPADDDRVLLEGRVEKRALAQGSKSAHEGMVLVLADGTCHVLRRAGGNAFRDPALEALEGRQVRLRGRIRPNFFLLDAIDDEPSD
jgi:hypothetical protein